MMTTAQTAKKLKLSRRRVLTLIQSGRLKATRFGPSWVIDVKALDAVRIRKVGRPKGKG
jgi:excisionase family DNA binding protein